MRRGSTADHFVTLTEWELIKPELFKLIRRNRRRVVKWKAMWAAQERQSTLRHPYNELLDAQPTERKHFMPVFDDFLLFESVRPLWDRPSAPTRADWLAAKSLIVEELDDWRVEIVAHASASTAAVAKILETDPGLFKLDFQDGGKVDLLEFSELVSCFVSCRMDSCDRIGPLREVLQHQHLQHNHGDRLIMEVIDRLTARTRATIPLTVFPEAALALKALLDAAELDPALATSSDLDDLQRRVLRWEWENSNHYRRNYDHHYRRDYDTWKTLVSLGVQFVRLAADAY